LNLYIFSLNFGNIFEKTGNPVLISGPYALLLLKNDKKYEV